jgi:two-component system CheB/CheR fusion protein
MAKTIAKSKSANTKNPNAIDSTNPPLKHFPVVGFGASAGGLEAFTSVLKHLGNNLGMAYVLVMHLSPKYKSSLREILQTKTKMKVHTVRNGMAVLPDNIYVIPPNAFMSLVDGHLKLAPRSRTAHGNFAVDYFFDALASTYKNNAIGVILSGTATDGTLGLRAIKAEGGITFAQDDSAKFPGMPTSAYESGYADFVLSPENIAKELARLTKISYTGVPAEKIKKKHAANLNSETEEVKKILGIVKEKTGIDFFGQYKRASIYRRIIRRVVLNKCNTLRDYCLMLAGNEREISNLYNDFLINVTHFFRDPDFYKMLDDKVFPSVVKHRKHTDTIRIWVAGGATGEEPYSIAICLMEFLEKKKLDIAFQVFGSDLDADAIEKARLGIFSISALQNVSEARLKKFFKKVDGYWQVHRNVRETCIFSQHNLLRDPPFSRMDLISCQNVLIYLENSPQQKILQTFHYALKPTGYLFLGKSETIGLANDMFAPIDKKIRIYTRKSTPSPPLQFSTPMLGSAIAKESILVGNSKKHDLEKDIQRILLKRFVQPSVVVDQNLNIVQFFGVTAPYFSPVVGKASLNILKMIRDELLIHLRTLLQVARKTGRPTIKEGIRISDKKSEHEVTIEVVPQKKGSELFCLVVFTDSPPALPIKIGGRKNKKSPAASQKEETIIKLEEELLQSREIIKTTNEEYETTYEELQANSEEILSSNEELQSINEELETSKEELQSANEELTTINEELQKRNVELKESQNYAKAIVNTVHNPFLVLTSNLQVRSANRSFYNTFKLEPETTEGSFIFELGNETWNIPDLRNALNELLGNKTNYLEFNFNHFFPGIGELVFIVNAYRLLKEDQTDKEILILLAFTNISEVHKANEKLKYTNQHLEEFAFVASHDLQEPIRKIQIFSNLISEHEHPNIQTKTYVDKIIATASGMSSLLRDLLNYSTILKSREKKFVYVDLNTTLKDVVQDLEDLINTKNAAINAADLPSIEAVPIQMHQLFFNLLMNALNFNNAHPIINVTVENISAEDYKIHGLKHVNRYFRINVSDNGIGFDQTYSSKLFTIFQRFKDKADVEGSGIGLAICKKIVEDHQGIIFAEGKKNDGAIFSVILPSTQHPVF